MSEGLNTKRSLGLLEIKNITRGIQVADVMLKSANVELVIAQPLCVGKYVVIVAGDVGAVQNAVRSGHATVKLDSVLDKATLSNIHSSVFNALSGRTQVKEIKSLGIIETRSVVSAIIAADAAVKAAAVDLVKIHLARFIGGKAVVSLSGETSAVTAAIRAGSSAIQDSGFLIDQLVISSPHKGLQGATF